VSVEDVSAFVSIKSLKRNSRLIAHKLETAWFVGVVWSIESNKRVAGQFAVKYKC
jgi:hypothetical protein